MEFKSTANKARDRSDFRRGNRTDNYNEAYDVQREVVSRGRRPSFKGPRRGGRGRQNYNVQRIEDHRSPLITMNDLSEYLKKKLFPEVKDGQSAMERLEVVQTFKAITLCVTTRGIGFSTVSVFRALFEFNNVPICGDIYQFYRVSLAVTQTKVALAQRGVVAIMDNDDDYRQINVQEVLSVVKGMIVVPDQLSSIVNSIGKVKVGDRLYVPKIGKDNLVKENNLLIPQAEQVVYDNLRKVVLSLANVNTPAHYRRTFYQCNPIPGTIWMGVNEDNPVLINPDDIIPDEYTTDDLAKDICDIKTKLSFLNKKEPKYFTAPISLSPEGTKSMLVCNEQENLRVIDRNIGEPLEQYYTRLKLTGDITEYFSLENLAPIEQINGTLCLLGETPTTIDLKYPIYIGRDKRVCSFKCSIQSHKATP